MRSHFPQFHARPGWIEVIVGCMFSGKTEALLTQIRRAEIARQSYKLFKPATDTRYSETDVESHNKNAHPSIVVSSPEDIYMHVEHKTQVIGIDEAQFFDENIVSVCQRLANAGRRVIVAGLDTDWQGQPFGSMPALMATAEIVRKEYAICMQCGEPATRTQRLINSQDEILLGSTDSYEARCRNHFDPELPLRLERQTPRGKTDDVRESP